MEFHKNKFVLSSGRKFYANKGILGLTPNCSELTYGYDGSAFLAYDCTLTKEERREIAMHMIQRWLLFAEKGLVLPHGQK